MSSPREKGATSHSTTPCASFKRPLARSRMLSRGRVVLEDFLADALPAISYHTGMTVLDRHRRHIPTGSPQTTVASYFDSVDSASDSCKVPEASKSWPELLLK